MTFSLVGRCAETGMFGLVICSSSPAVAARCSFARAGVGAVASQNITDPVLGTAALDFLESGMNANQAVEAVKAKSHNIEYRQLVAVDRQGQTAVYSGKHTLGTWAESKQKDTASAGNLLSSTDVPVAMTGAFQSSSGHIGDRLLEALRAGLLAGGEEGPVRSAGLKIVDDVTWPVADLRCDWSENCPVRELARLWDLYRPQMDDYKKRALDPTNAPAYGVPGDE